MKALTTLFVIGMFATAVAVADDVDDVKAAMQRYFAALNTGDADAFIQSRMPGSSVFAEGGLLERSGSAQEQKNGFQAAVDAGQKLNLQIRNFEVKVYGNTAVTTCYVVGTVTPPGGTTERTAVQRTGVWIKQGGQWKEVHSHRSDLRLSQ